VDGLTVGVHSAADTEPVVTESGSEPVVISHAITVLLGALVSTGWAVIPDRDVDTIASVAALVIAGIATVLTRARVRPTRTALLVDIGKVAAAVAAEAVAEQLAQHQPDPEAR
jgi:hypothetical protein